MGQMFDTPALARLSALLQEVRNGTLLIPEFQRGYVWGDEQRLRLMDSIWQGIPIGSLLVWRTGSDKGLKVRTEIGPCTLPTPRAASVRSYVIDGLQRLTTLYAALMPLPEGHERDAEGRRWPIYFELAPKAGDDLRFHLRHGQQEVSSTWMPLSCVLDDDLFFEFRAALVSRGHKDLLQEARRLESRFRDYLIPVVPLVSEDQELVTEAFARVNSLGQDLDEGDMAHALTLGDAFSFNGELSSLTSQLSSVGWEGVDRKVVIASLKAIWNLDIYKSGAKGIQGKLNTTEGRDLLRALPQIFEPVAELLRGFGVHGPGSLPYTYQLVALLRAAQRLGGEKVLGAADGLRTWFFWSTYNEHFTGMTSGQLRGEFERLEALIRGERALDWLERPVVTPLGQLRANAVRSRAAILAMAIEGDGLTGGSKQQRLYGARGTEALQRLFPGESPYILANRVLAEDEDLKRLREWLTPGQLRLTTPEVLQDDLLRRNHLGFVLEKKSVTAASPFDAATLTDAHKILRAREYALDLFEAEFVEDLGAKWQPDT
ncbi:Hypothetical protein CAP_0954 [Chondromyces apiculatus DSM 436]|uniref:GmrSD restriction endonucleases N-terminal domain-containing protein n=2 Tax=Chondromyces apiculatus TaxID=51 RepID=A0A017SU44_9BACT|nr:Hypothetical protein CAP_0954 [Chondromyces apiculatus DSM 436]